MSQLRRRPGPRSVEPFNRVQCTHTGGVNFPNRACDGGGAGAPTIIDSSNGARIMDVGRNKYVNRVGLAFVCGRRSLMQCP